MRNRAPVPASERPPIPAFAPVPRKVRHAGWTMGRGWKTRGQQKAFIEALADCGPAARATVAPWGVLRAPYVFHQQTSRRVSGRKAGKGKPTGRSRDGLRASPGASLASVRRP